jgi:hypothetical protein
MSSSYLERITEQLIKDAGLPEPIREFKFCEDRQWRSDFVWLLPPDRLPLKGVILEVEGGIFMKKSGHNTGVAITRDIEKGNEAALLGYLVIRSTKYHLITGQTMKWVKRALNLP